MPKPKYAHMRVWEEKIMDKFLEKIKFPATWQFDVHLHVQDRKDISYMSENEKFLFNQATAKRIDAVGETVDRIYVVEVKDRLRPSAVGQALTYKLLYERQFKPAKLVVPAIITEFTDPDMEFVCEKFGIRVWVV